MTATLKEVLSQRMHVYMIQENSLLAPHWTARPVGAFVVPTGGCKQRRRWVLPVPVYTYDSTNVNQRVGGESKSREISFFLPRLITLSETVVVGTFVVTIREHLYLSFWQHFRV